MGKSVVVLLTFLGLWIVTVYSQEPCILCDKDACEGKCVANAVCKSDDDAKRYTCECSSGYRGDGYRLCEDINECSENPKICGPNANCENLPGSYKCTCIPGKMCNLENGKFKPSLLKDPIDTLQTINRFELKPPLQKTISQDDPSDWSDPGWILRAHNDHELSVTFPLPLGLRNKVPGTYKITYTVVDRDNKQYFTPQHRTVVVEDVDECLRGTHSCSPNAICTNTIGSYTCACKPGFVGDGFTCSRQPCKDLSHGCDVNADCIPDSTERGYHCECRTGWKGDGFTCTDLDECLDPSLYRCPPHSHCVNVPGFYKCECDEGWENLAGSDPNICTPEQLTCIDIDECARGLHNCHKNAYCKNLPGSFQCICKKGYQGDGVNICEMNYDFDFGINGPDPLIISQCDSYNEYGLHLDDRMEEKAMLRIHLPKELREDMVTHTGHYVVDYYLNEGLPGNRGEKHITRKVIVNPINRCELPKDHPCMHNCHRLARCVYDINNKNGYRCECPEGFVNVYDEQGNVIDCRDAAPPIIELRGDNPVILGSCRVCKRVISEGEAFSEEKHGGYSAYDIYPDGSTKDLTSRVKSEMVYVDDTYSKVIYSVTDDAGNHATMQRDIHTVIEDVHRDIELVKKYVEEKLLMESQASQRYLDGLMARIWYYVKLGLEILLVLVALLFVVLFLPALYNTVTVWWAVNVQGKKVPFPDYLDAYMMIYLFTHPFWSKQKKERTAHQNYHKIFHDY